jgi:4-hydroxymandelate oxidase
MTLSTNAATKVRDTVEQRTKTSADEHTMNLNDLVSLFDFEAAARPRILPQLWEYYSGVADEISLRWNREAYDTLRLRPRVLVDVSKIDTRVTLFGHDLAHPILLAPTADHRMAHPDGEVAVVRGAGSADTITVLSSFTTTSLEEVAQNATAPLWFQVYIQRDREFTRDAVQRAVAAGFKALCVTVDTPVFGARDRQARAKVRTGPGAYSSTSPATTQIKPRGALSNLSWLE